MTTPLSSHGTIIARAPAATPTVFTDIAELGDIVPPELMRKGFDTSVQNKNIDFYVHGMLRRNPVTFPMNFIPTDTSHDHLTGLYNALTANSFDGYRFAQTATGMLWVASGQVESIKADAKVDGTLTAAVTLRMSGPMGISSNNGPNMVQIGT